MKFINNSTLTAILILLFPMMIFAGDITGKWQGEFDSMVGKQVYIYTISMAGDSLTGSAEADIAGEKYQSKLSDIKVKEDVIQFVESLDYQGMPLVIQYKGKIVGDEIHFSRTVGDFAAEEFVAKRLPAGENPKK
jgi:hypothetical protein